MFKIDIKNIDKKILSLMFNGFKFSSIILIISLYILLLYKFYPISHILFESGILLFRASLMFAVSFFINGFLIDQFSKNKI